MSSRTSDANQRVLAELGQELLRDPDNHELLKKLGNAHKATGDLAKAIDCYRRSLTVAPDYLPSLYNLGLVLHELNRLAEAEETFRRAHAVAAEDIDVLIHLGVILCKRSRMEEGAQKFRAALRFAPDNPDLWLWLGRACGQVQHLADESIQSLLKCIALKPDLAEAYCELGMAYRKLGDIGRAAEMFGKALERQPDLVEAVEGLGEILQDEGDPDAAIERYAAAIRTSPDSARLHSGLGCAQFRKGRLQEAAASFSRAIDLEPEFAGAIHNLGKVHDMRGARDEALLCYERALQLSPGDAIIRESVLFEKQNMCDWARFEELGELQRRGVFEHPPQHVSPFCLLSIASTRAEQLQSARNFAQGHVRSVARARPQFEFDRRPRSRLRIGYLSSDFHQHAVACLIAELFELHDRGRFEVVGYSHGPEDGSPMRSRLKRGFDRFTDIRTVSHAAAAAAIHANGIDILVDLNGYTQHARTGILALRPAPLQVNYLGYPGTMGADFIDYLIGDHFIISREHAADYSEKLVLLPGSYQVNDRQRPIAATPSRRELGLPESGFVFCCFNNVYKILPETFAVWMRLLQGAPGSVLWMLESNRWAAENLRQEAGRRGVDPGRLIFAPMVSLDRHLGRMRAADLFLDTLPYNAHTSASDALWAGLPVLTVPGETFASRVGGSLLRAVGMPELIADSIRSYEALALELALQPGRITAVRDKLARNKDTALLFDTPRFTRDLESAYEAMWRQYMSGGTPTAIEI